VPVAPQQGSAESSLYGLQHGSIGGWIGAGPQFSFANSSPNHTHPAITGGFDYGLTKYLGLYGNVTGVLAFSARVGEIFGGGGLMVSACHRSRLVPFGRFGVDYGQRRFL
jgi:hypothetical protein